MTSSASKQHNQTHLNVIDKRMNIVSGLQNVKYQIFFFGWGGWRGETKQIRVSSRKLIMCLQLFQLTCKCGHLHLRRTREGELREGELETRCRYHSLQAERAGPLYDLASRTFHNELHSIMSFTNNTTSKGKNIVLREYWQVSNKAKNTDADNYSKVYTHRLLNTTRSTLETSWQLAEN